MMLAAVMAEEGSQSQPARRRLVEHAFCDWAGLVGGAPWWRPGVGHASSGHPLETQRDDPWHEPDRRETSPLTTRVV